MLRAFITLREKVTLRNENKMNGNHSLNYNGEDFSSMKKKKSRKLKIEEIKEIVVSSSEAQEKIIKEKVLVNAEVQTDSLKVDMNSVKIFNDNSPVKENG